MRILLRLLQSLPLLIVSPVFLTISALGLLLTDLLHRLRGAADLPEDEMPATHAASVVIPNWNGKDLLQKYLPSVVTALAGHADNEVIVVDNGSEDGSAKLLAEHFPKVRVLALPENLGFGGGSNAGFEAARNDIVVLLNSDMRVEPDFLDPLLKGFTDSGVFSVACQIFFSDPEKTRQETGLTEAWWDSGGLRVRHIVDEMVDRPFPCFYGGGGSCAFDRRKFLQLGGFDSLLAPFYLEDTDLGFMAWKRGWKVLYAPASMVFHEHRGTIGKTFSDDYIQGVLHKNFILFIWKNIHEWRRLVDHFAYAWAGSAVSAVFGPSLERATFGGIWRAFRQLPAALRSRNRAMSLSAVDDTEAFRRPLGGYFRDRFAALPAKPDRLRVLFVSPYPICPPVHGGAVFMSQTCQYLARDTDLHLVVNIDSPDEQQEHAQLVSRCASAEFVLRLEGKPKQPGAITPYAIREFANRDLNWTIHRKLLLDDIDVLQLEYLPMGQYGGQFNRLACILFEHDVYFQSIARTLQRSENWLGSVKPFIEYMRAVRYELDILPRFDRVQVCSSANADYVKSFLPGIADRLDHGYRAGIDVTAYDYASYGRQPKTLLFVGSFRHLPNVAALNWLVNQVLPFVLEKEPTARLIVVGSDPPARHIYPDLGDALELRGFVEDVKEPLARCSLFVCPILSGSGVRVKLLEAFATGIPCVSTTVGAEGLADTDGDICALADEPAAFAQKILDLIADPPAAAEMAARARRAVEERWDMATITGQLVESYHETVSAKRTSSA